MHIYLKKNRAKFHRHPIWNDRALGFSEDDRPNNNKNKMSSDTGSVPEPKRYVDHVINTHI